VDAQRLIVAREASSYMKAEKKALAVQEKAAEAEAKADVTNALLADDAAKRAQRRAAALRKRAALATAKAAKYAAQVKTYDDDYWNNKKWELVTANQSELEALVARRIWLPRSARARLKSKREI
jgi:hypothetical protein